MSALQRFLDQNDLMAAGLDERQRDVAGLYAEHHAGGLYVLWRPLSGDLAVKAHDSWADDEHIVVHVYDCVDPDRNHIEEFTDGAAALLAFMSATESAVDGEAP